MSWNGFFRVDYLITYSLVGGDKQSIEKVKIEVYKLKQSFLPDINPSEWTIHMKDMWNDKKKSKFFKNIDHSSLIDFSIQLCKIIQSSNLKIFNVSGLYHQPKKLKKRKEVFNFVRNDCYLFLLMVVLNQTTGRNIKPCFNFDKSGKDGWAETSFLSSTATLVYTFISNGVDIEEPKFLEAASHTYLELADFISFIIARFIHRTLLERSIEVNPKLLGDIHYLGFNSRGEPKDILTSGYPLEFFSIKQFSLILVSTVSVVMHTSVYSSKKLLLCNNIVYALRREPS